MLDEMYPRRIAEQLRKSGHDVSAIDERPDLRADEDEDVLLIATREGRALATENVADFPEIVQSLALEGREHRGVVLLSRRAFPRTDRGLGVIVRSLAAYLEEHAVDDGVPGGLHWLRPAP